MRQPNVLFIPVDDLRPQLYCYGRTQMKTPNIDRLAERGTLFQRAYCQVPVCGATRASLLTGVRPARDRFVTYDTWVDQDLPGARTLPQHFREHGYVTRSLGKVFHHRTDTAERSWSETPWYPRVQGTWRNYVLEENQRIEAVSGGRGPAYECADVLDSAYKDGKIADQAIQELHRLKASGEPFFLATGFIKPHLPFNAPRKYWDMYRGEDVNLADNPFRPEDAPDAAIHNWGELRSYFNIPKEGALSDEMARTLVHGYYAATSYMDTQIGRILDTLDELGLSENTVVLLWGDHGWQLGEHGLWCKHCNFNTSLNAPLIVSVPDGIGEQVSNALVEFVDVYPTLCELAGLPLPEHLHGSSMVPLLESPDHPWKDAVFSRYIAGDSIRTDQYLYTEWRDRQGKRTARMLYDHESDPDENVNLSERTEYRDRVTELAERLQAGIEIGESV